MIYLYLDLLIFVLFIYKQLAAVYIPKNTKPIKYEIYLGVVL